MKVPLQKAPFQQHCQFQNAVQNLNMISLRAALLDLLRDRIAEESNSNESDDDDDAAVAYEQLCRRRLIYQVAVSEAEDSLAASRETHSTSDHEQDSPVQTRGNEYSDAADDAGIRDARTDFDGREAADESGSEEKNGSKTRQKNAQRKKRTRKWNVSGEKKPRLADAGSAATPAGSDQPSCSSRVTPAGQTSGDSAEEASAYKRSAEKLSESITKTDLKLAKVAEKLVQALQGSDDEHESELGDCQKLNSEPG